MSSNTPVPQRGPWSAIAPRRGAEGQRSRDELETRLFRLTSRPLARRRWRACPSYFNHGGWRVPPRRTQVARRQRACPHPVGTCLIEEVAPATDCRMWVPAYAEGDVVCYEAGSRLCRTREALSWRLPCAKHREYLSPGTVAPYAAPLRRICVLATQFSGLAGLAWVSPNISARQHISARPAKPDRLEDHIGWLGANPLDPSISGAVTEWIRNSGTPDRLAWSTPHLGDARTRVEVRRRRHARPTAAAASLTACCPVPARCRR